MPRTRGSRTPLSDEENKNQEKEQSQFPRGNTYCVAAVPCTPPSISTLLCITPTDIEGVTRGAPIPQIVLGKEDEALRYQGAHALDCSSFSKSNTGKGLICMLDTHAMSCALWVGMPISPITLVIASQRHRAARWELCQDVMLYLFAPCIRWKRWE